MPAHEAEWQPVHRATASQGEAHVQRASIVEYVDIREPARLEPSSPARILEPAESEAAAHGEPVAPVPAYPPAAPQAMWSEPASAASRAPVEEPVPAVAATWEPAAARQVSDATPAEPPAVSTAARAEAMAAEATPPTDAAPVERLPEPIVTSAPAVAQAAEPAPETPRDVPTMPAAVIAESKPEEPPQPARRGWWQRRFGL